MNIAEFGQTIKKKYPQYNDLSDEEIGSKMLEKYPQYKDMVTVAPVIQQSKEPSTLEKVVNYAAPKTLEAAKVITQIPQAWRKNVEELKQNGPFAAPSPELRKLYGGTGVETGNRFLNAASDAWKMTQTSSRAGTELGSLASLVKSIPSGIKNLLHPLKNTGKKLEMVRSTVEVPKSESESKIFENITKDRRYTLNPELQKEVQGGFTKLIKGTNPGAETNNLNEIYQNLNSIKGLSPDAKSILNKAVRDYATPLQTEAGVKLEKAYSLLKTYEDVPQMGLKRGLQWAIATAIAGTVGGLTWKRFSK